VSAENGFAKPEKCFVARPMTKYSAEKANDFNGRMEVQASGFVAGG
jgi:hypothetical protein